MKAPTLSRSSTAAFVILIYLFLFIIGYKAGEFGDDYFWYTWSGHMYCNGLSEAYGSGTNYMPLIQYVLFIYGKLMGGLYEIKKYTTLLKCFPLLFEFIGIWYVYKLLDKKIPFLFLLLVNVLNLGYIYISLIWGQFDAVLATLNFIAFYYAYKQRLTLSFVFYVLALNMKVQAVVIMPVIGFFYLDNILDSKKLSSVIQPLFAAIVVQVLLLLPFAWGEGGLGKIIEVFTTSVGMYPYVSLNATNIWDVIFYPTDPLLVKDTVPLIAGISYKTSGLIMFCIASFFALLPLLKILIQKLQGRNPVMLSLDKLLLICAILYMSFFFFNTEMHERYVHPAFIFIMAYSFLKRKYLLYISFSVVNFLILERVMQWLRLNNYHTVLFTPVVLATVLGVLLLYTYYLLYRKESVSMVTTINN